MRRPATSPTKKATVGVAVAAIVMVGGGSAVFAFAPVDGVALCESPPEQAIEIPATSGARQMNQPLGFTRAVYATPGSLRMAIVPVIFGLPAATSLRLRAALGGAELLFEALEETRLDAGDVFVGEGSVFGLVADAEGE